MQRLLAQQEVKMALRTLQRVLAPHRQAQRGTEAKQKKRVAMGIQIAHLPAIKTLEELDFKFQPSLDAKLVRELATGRFIAGAENVLLFGPPGVGKTHLAIALGRAAVEAGHSALFVTATSLLAALSRAQLVDQLAFYAKPKLLVVDELGYLPLEKQTAHLFFQLVSRRYERGSSSPPTRPSRSGSRLRRRDDRLGRARPRAPPQSRPAHPGRQPSLKQRSEPGSSAPPSQSLNTRVGSGLLAQGGQFLVALDT
jgi:DNA replication protein DnaC